MDMRYRFEIKLLYYMGRKRLWTDTRDMKLAPICRIAKDNSEIYSLALLYKNTHLQNAATDQSESSI